jgi:hypothetical protein
MYWVLGFLLLVAILIAGFVVIARKGRALRQAQPLPPPATKAFLRWVEDGKTFELEIQAPFYLGRKSDSNLILKNARADYEICIFYHKQRFAFESLDRAGIIFVNGEEKFAGYLGDSDVIQVAGREFTFHCF